MDAVRAANNKYQGGEHDPDHCYLFIKYSHKSKCPDNTSQHDGKWEKNAPNCFKINK